MELRSASRSTNILETSRLDFSIGYILRLKDMSSTEKAQCGVLPPFAPSKQARVSAMLQRSNFSKRTVLTFTGLLVAAGVSTACVSSAMAADPTGDWRVEEGTANIRVAQCNGAMWGAVSWEKTLGGRDTNNPDVAKQSRPTLGMAILMNMKKKAGADQWEGQVYNAKDGKLYDSTITSTDAQHLEIQGCVLGFLCGGETWTRVGPPIPSSPANSMAKGTVKPASPAPKVAAATPQTTGNGTASPAKPADPVGDICLLPEISRAR